MSCGQLTPCPLHWLNSGRSAGTCLPEGPAGLGPAPENERLKDHQHGPWSSNETLLDQDTFKITLVLASDNMGFVVNKNSCWEIRKNVSGKSRASTSKHVSF